MANRHHGLLRALTKAGSLGFLALCMTASSAQVSTVSTAAAAPESESVVATPTETLPSSAPVTQVQIANTSKVWQQLNPSQKQALAPLGAQWGALSAQQQNKWLVISQNFSTWPVADQITLHTRMSDWVKLSPQQRNLARFNFNKLQNLPKEDKKAQWEAYQALSEDDRRLLAADAKKPPKSAAPTAKLPQPHRVVQTPARAAVTNPAQSTTVIDRKTLLPLSQGQNPTTVPAPDRVRLIKETSPS